MITYPVPKDARFTVKFNGETHRGREWSRDDGGPIPNPPAGLVILLESEEPRPSFDPLTQKLAASWVDDHANQSAVRTWTVVQLTPEEAAEAADTATRLQHLRDMGAAISTLESWATELEGITATTNAQALALINNLKGKQVIFFRRFAGLLRGLRIDQQ